MSQVSQVSKIVRFTLVMGAVAWAGAACTKRVESVEEARPLEEYYPLAIGNRWTYEATFLGEKSEQVIEIVKVDEEGFFADSAGNQLRFDAFGLRDPKRYLLRAPLEQGQTWNSVVSVSSMERYQVAAVGAPCPVPAGDFKGCVKVEGRNRVDQKNTMIIEWTFAPKVGLVRIDTTLESEGKRIPQTKLLLKAYSVKEPQAEARP